MIRPERGLGAAFGRVPVTEAVVEERRRVAGRAESDAELIAVAVVEPVVTALAQKTAAVQVIRVVGVIQATVLKNNKKS